MPFNLNKLSNREQILIFVSFTIYIISFINDQNETLKKENQNIISRLDYIKSIPANVSTNRNLYSDNISILVNSTSKEKKIQIDRTQPLNENSMMVWVNEVNFIDLLSLIHI